MNPSDLPLTVLPIVTLLAGALLGWGLTAAHNRRRRHTAAPSKRDQMEMHVDESQDAIHAAEVELAQLDVRANYLTRALATMRQQIKDAETEHDKLLVALDERKASVKDVQNNLQNIHQNLQTRTQEADKMLTNIDKSIEELDMLNQMKDSYAVKINRLTQQVQWQDSELRMLRQTMKTKTAEMDEARELLEQRDAELRMLIRQRQQREIDIEHARQALAQRTDELRRQVSAPGNDPFISEHPPTLLAAQQRIDVTPPEPRRLPAVHTPPAPPPRSSTITTAEMELEDDLTVIPRLSEFYARQMHAHGIRSIRRLAEMSADEVRAILDIPPHHSPNIEGWLKAARKLTRRTKDG